MAPTPMPYSEEFKARIEVTKAFCDSAKTYIQISSAALALPLLFTQAILGKQVAEEGLGYVPYSLRVSWLFFALSILCATLYQWLATRRLWDELHLVHRTDQNASEPGYRRTWWIFQEEQLRHLNLSAIYGLMVLLFVLGGISFVVFAGGRISN